MPQIGGLNDRVQLQRRTETGQRKFLACRCGERRVTG
jgi:hypothetical protein